MKRVVAERDPGERDARVDASTRAAVPRPSSRETVLALQRAAGNHAVARALARPQLARATHEKVFPDLGTYTVDLKPELNDVKYGQAITLTFQPLPLPARKKPEPKRAGFGRGPQKRRLTPPSEEDEPRLPTEGDKRTASAIELLQVAKSTRPTADGPKDHAWSGDQQIRNLTKTPDAFFVDRVAGNPRTSSKDPEVRPEYNYSYQDPETKIGHNIAAGVSAAARLFDHAGANQPVGFDFKTAVLATRNGKESTWATAEFGFQTARNGESWEIRSEYASFSADSHPVVEQARGEFDAVYRNPSALTSPETMDTAIRALADAVTTGNQDGIVDAQTECDRILAECRRIANKPNPFDDPTQVASYEKLKATYATLATSFQTRRNTAATPVAERPADASLDYGGKRPAPQPEVGTESSQKKPRQIIEPPPLRVPEPEPEPQPVAVTVGSEIDMFADDDS